MFRSSTLIREPALILAKVIFMLKYSVQLLRYYEVVWQHVMECRVLYDVKNAHSAQHATHTPFYDMLPHNRIINYDEIHQIF